MENEVRLIDANAFIETIEKIACEDKTPFFHLDEITQEIFDAPTIDPESLRPKGRWVMKETMIRSPFAKNAYCSECLWETAQDYNFCPNCGAKMEI
jgi:hypothetical protein